MKPNYEGEFLFERIGAGAKDFIECGAPDAYFGDPAAATAENADKQYDVFSDYVVDEVRAYWDNSREGWGMSIMNEKKFGRILETGMGFIMSWVLNTSAMYLLGAPMTPATVFPA